MEMSVDVMDTSGDDSEASGDGVFQLSSSDTIALGVGIGAAFLVLLIGVLVVVVIVVKRRKRGRRGDWTVPGMDSHYKGKRGLEAGVTNAVYDYRNDAHAEGSHSDGDEKAEDDLHPASYSMPREMIKRPTTTNEERKSCAYDYATTEQAQISFNRGGISHFETKPKQSSKHGKEPQPFNWSGREQQSSSGYTRERIYVTPANEETTLYAQIIDIKIEELPRSSIQLGDCLGTGNFGTVVQGLVSIHGGEMKVAVKTLKEGSGEEDRVKFLQEAAIMGQFKHHNVVKLHGVVMEGEPVLIVLELLANGDLKKHLASQRFETKLSVDEHTLLSYCRQVASGMVYLSNKAFIHRDLAARNILLSEQGLCKIADFGLTRDLTDEDYYISHGGKIPVKWTAPEAIHYRKYSSASDVWSYGVLMFEIWGIGCHPYEGLSIQQVVAQIEEGYRLPPPPATPRAVYELMINTWNDMSASRPTFEDIMETLSLPDTVLLQSTAGDDIDGESGKLGDELSCSYNLYMDLQHKYYLR